MADIVYSFEMKHISKRFGAVEALRDVSFAVRPGTIHALCGENGAGKSALTKILAGIYPPDSGEILLRGARISFSSPAAAVRAGVAMVHQESDLAPDLTVAENIFLGVERLIGGRFVQVLDTGAMNREADDMIDCHGFMLKPDTVVADLTPAKRQQVEILKALNRKAQILILDEPTASLSLREMQELFAIIRELRNTGMAVVYISHRLDVVLDIADEVTVLRDGAQVFSGARSAVTADRVVKLMVGRELEELYPASDARPGCVFFEARELSDRSGRVSRVGFTLRRGEIVGFAGLVGAGRSETMQCLFGLTPGSTGDVYLNGQKVHIHNAVDAMKLGIAMVPENRKLEGLYHVQSVKFNSTIEVLEKFINSLMVNSRLEEQITQEFIDKMRTKTPSQEQRVANLSGGNQQKVMIGRWLATDPKILILDEPTRGVDVGAKAEIYEIMNELTKQGVSIIMISSELPEIINMADRVYVMYEGRVTGCIPYQDVSQEAIMKLATLEATEGHDNG